MHTCYTLNTDELNQGFLAAIQALYPHKTVEIVIHEADFIREDQQVSALPHDVNLTPFPDRSTVSGVGPVHQTPDYLTLEVDDILIPARDARYER